MSEPMNHVEPFPETIINRDDLNDPDQELLNSWFKPTKYLADLVYVKGASLSYHEPSKGYTALHAAAEAGAEEQVRWFLANGAPWNHIDNDNNTPAELALREDHPNIYNVIFEAAVEQEWKRFNEPPMTKQENLKNIIDVDTSNDSFLNERVQYTDPNPHIKTNDDSFAMVSESGAGVMMEWARPIMQETARLLFDGMGPGMSCLNIGFGMGIMDSYLQLYKPAHHTIIEAHPDVLAYMRRTGWYDKPGVRILEGRWQDFIGVVHPAVSDAEELSRPAPTPETINGHSGSKDMVEHHIGRFDIVYFDTFEEGYRAFTNFWKCVPDLLRTPQSRLAFFHCHARNNTFAYMVYTEVATRHLKDLGLATVWHDVNVDPKKVWYRYADADKKERDELIPGENNPWKIPISTPAPITLRDALHSSYA